MALDRHILTIVEPKVKLDPLQTSNFGERESGDAHSSMQGGLYPLIRVNGQIFQQEEVLKFTLDMSGKYPEIRATLKDMNNVFTVDQFPRDGDILSLRIELDKAGTYKDIRMDFVILEFNGIPTKTLDKVSGESKYNVRAIAKIPGMYTDECKPYGNKPSLDHIKDIASDLKIGVATNIDNTQDAMNRFCAYQTKLEFLDKTVMHSYISDDAFISYSIDPYYYVNFVNLQKVFNAPNVVEKFEMITKDHYNERGTDPKEGAGKEEIDLILTNHHNAKGINIEILKYNVVNNSTKIVLENGYRRKMQYFDVDNNELLEFDVESLVSDSLGDREEALKGRRNSDTDEYDTHIKQKYVGLQNDNLHANYNYAFINNVQNIVELDKMYLEIELAALNPALYKYMKVPVQLYNYGANANAVADKLNEKLVEKDLEQDSKEDSTSDNQGPSNFTLDKFLSAHYVIMGIKYNYSQKDGYTQTLKLARREWPAKVNNI